MPGPVAAGATPGARAAMQTRPFAIAIHGGAGTITRAALTPGVEADYRATLAAALRAGQQVLAADGPSLDAVAAAVRVLEDSPLFNAGRGSVFTHDGRIEMDASIMDGRDRRAGAVAALTTIRNPIDAARAVMERSRHVLLVGAGAEEFAREQGLATAEPEYFRTALRWEQLRVARESDRLQIDHDAPASAPAGDGGAAPGDGKYGTVGAVALDRDGNLAAATSTGGLTNKRFGRVGDSPIIGAGTWAENESVAVSATGSGETFIRAAAAHELAALVKYGGRTPRRAADEVLATVERLGGHGGLIVIDRSGEPVFAFNTEGMYRGCACGVSAPEVAIYR
jgi:beta-aspartyl-peptidase (threonine type)